MNRRLAGLLALAVLIPGGALTLGDYRDGKSRFWLSGGVEMFTFDHRANPLLFWASTIVNIAFIGALTVVCALAVVLP